MYRKIKAEKRKAEETTKAVSGRAAFENEEDNLQAEAIQKAKAAAHVHENARAQKEVEKYRSQSYFAVQAPHGKPQWCIFFEYKKKLIYAQGFPPKKGNRDRISDTYRTYEKTNR